MDIKFINEILSKIECDDDSLLRDDPEYQIWLDNKIKETNELLLNNTFAEEE